MADVKTDSISSTEFGKLFFEFKPRFIALAYRYVRDRETAEDLVSDSFMTFGKCMKTCRRTPMCRLISSPRSKTVA
ncbi:MAG: sigma factor [Alistipes communis]